MRTGEAFKFNSLQNLIALLQLRHIFIGDNGPSKLIELYIAVAGNFLNLPRPRRVKLKPLARGLELNFLHGGLNRGCISRHWKSF